jgi:hypothetical protein
MLCTSQTVPVMILATSGMRTLYFGSGTILLYQEGLRICVADELAIASINERILFALILP